MTDTAPTAVTARVPATFQSRSKVPNVAQNNPAVANKRSPPTPELPIVVRAEHQETGNDDRSADDTLKGRLFVKNEGSKHKSRQCGASGLNCGAMPERNENETAVREQGLRWSRQDGHHRRTAPADAAKIAQSLAYNQRQHQQAGPEEAMKGEIGG